MGTTSTGNGKQFISFDLDAPTCDIFYLHSDLNGAFMSRRVADMCNVRSFLRHGL